MFVIAPGEEPTPLGAIYTKCVFAFHYAAFSLFFYVNVLKGLELVSFGVLKIQCLSYKKFKSTSLGQGFSVFVRCNGPPNVIILMQETPILKFIRHLPVYGFFVQRHNLYCKIHIINMSKTLLMKYLVSI